MAFLHRLCILLPTITFILSLTSPVQSLTCPSQKLTGNNLYTNCTDLPALNASLHWTHVANNSSLSIAFVAPPAKPNGWIAWAINPKQTGMVGSQALVAFKDSNGSMTVKTYNISSYSSIVEGKISFEVLDSRAEYSAGSMKIYATVKLPEEMTAVNHVWQVGGSVIDGRPTKHEFQPDNLMATGKLQLPEKAKSNATGTGTSTTATVGSPSIAPSPSSSSACRNTVMYVFFMLIFGGLISN